MALADHTFAESELAAFYEIAEKHGINKEDVDQIILNPATVRFTVPEDIETKVMYLYDYAKMILADGVIEEVEVSTLEKFCLKFGFESENIPDIRDLLLEAAKSKVPSSELLTFVTHTV